MKAFYFGPPAKPLFGALELPRKSSNLPRGVVLCAPVGHEAVRAHRALRQLSLRLAASGLHVLRFDYYGCGDSAGDCGEGDAEQWVSDVELAASELVSAAALPRLYLMGLRLGASLATLAAARRRDVEGLVLWEPVPDGTAYLEDQCALHRGWLTRRAEMAGPMDVFDDGGEILGFPLTTALRQTIGAIRLSELVRRPAPRVIIVERKETVGGRNLERRLADLGAEVTYLLVPDQAIWAAGPRDQAVVPRHTLDAVIDWIEKDRP